MASELENLLGWSWDLLELGLPLHSQAVHPSVTALPFHPLPPADGGPRGHSSPPGAPLPRACHELCLHPKTLELSLSRGDRESKVQHRPGLKEPTPQPSLLLNAFS